MGHYSVGSNVSARRLMLRAFGSDNHATSLKRTRALSLSDCYWLKDKSESVFFADISPYFNKEWDGTGEYSGGSISTLFVNGAANKRWENSTTLVKYNSEKEIVPYQLAAALGLNNTAKAYLCDKDLHITNFTTPDLMLETLEQSGHIGETDIPLEIAVSLFGESAVALLVLDYLVEHDDRHRGNLGFLRDTNTGEYLKMAPFYDFDWAWSGGVTKLPGNAFEKHSTFIKDLCRKAQGASARFIAPYNEFIYRRACELITK